MKRILSIDGGGIRGIIPLCALVELEKQTGKLTRDVFNMVAGTSTGAIIAAAVGIGMTAQKTLDLYQTLGSRIFKTDWLAFITTLGGMKYHSTACAAVYREFIGDVTINELPIDLMLTMMRVVDGKPFYAVKDNPANAGTTGKLKVVDCVTASAAAPTFLTRMMCPPLAVAWMAARALRATRFTRLAWRRFITPAGRIRQKIRWWSHWAPVFMMAPQTPSRSLTGRAGSCSACWNRPQSSKPSWFSATSPRWAHTGLTRRSRETLGWII